MDLKQVSAAARWTLGTLCVLIAVGVVGIVCIAVVGLLAYCAPHVSSGEMALMVAVFVGFPVSLLVITYVIVEWRVRGADRKRWHADHTIEEA